MLQTIKTDDAPAAIGPYSQAVHSDPFMFISGQLPINPETQQMVEGGIEKQTEQVMKNVEAILKTNGLGLGNVVKTTIFLSSMDHFTSFNEAYGRFFGTYYPARSAVEVSRLPKDSLIEVEVIALQSNKP
ncbi:endoribonuclease L-PSP [Pullulanibacillus camelliae]|uniref:Endoribonuclease L-PSP n=1 Tax=Pullulanibacillus camelliae TaxID=1707096 RepID=A0A8J2VK12_9BACL|nr:RidA family protein [Pullulanibacillus camelliae]GGE27047.1 endoribonuclease L-PSP [Pullulanibacillus camelliae]